MTSQRQMSATAASSNANADEIAATISVYLASRGVPPTPAWLQSFISTVRLATPLPALQKTALFRILSTDIQTSLKKAGGPGLPANVTDANLQQQILRGPFTVQVLDIEDIGRSRWSQVEAIEAQERGETTKGREIVRVVPDENADPDQTGINESSSRGPHKLVLQDANGKTVYGLEITPVNGIGLQLPIGAKLVLRDITLARGVLLLEPHCVDVLGGKVEVWEKKWKEERKARLQRQATQGGD